MKKNNDNKKMSAVQYLRTFEETQAVMESISSKTDTEQKVLMENMNPYGDSTDEGLFDMDNLLNVNLQDVDNQPRMYNNPIKPLNDSDKSLIADEFANMLKNMRVDSVELEEIGPMSTAIAMKNGMIVTSVEEFIKSLIDTAVEKQDSQSIALGLDEVPGIKEMETVVSPAPEVSAISIVSSEVASVMPEVMPEVSPATETPAAPVPEVTEDTEAPVENLEEEKEHVELAKKIEDKSTGEVKELASELKNEEAEEVKNLETKVGETPVEETEEDKEKDVISKLEAIKTNYKKAVIMEAEDKKLNSSLENIKNKYLSTLTEATTTAKVEVAEKKNNSPVVESTVTTIEEKKEAKKPLVEEDMEGGSEEVSDEGSSDSEEGGGDLFENAKTQLESIVAEYHASEKAKEKEAVVTAQLESIAESYHAKENAKKAAVKKDATVTAQLESIASDYLKKEKKAKPQPSVDARIKAKERIQSLK